MSYTLVLNSKNVIGANNNIFQYRFLNGFKISDNAEICISAAQVPYSWYDVSYFYQNTDFNIIFPRGAGLTTTDGEETITGSGAEATTVVETLAFFAGCFVPGGGAIFAGFACVFFEAGIGAID